MRIIRNYLSRDRSRTRQAGRLLRWLNIDKSVTLAIPTFHAVG